MTRDEILALKPGRELDWLIAVTLFGWDEDELNAVNIFGGSRLPYYSTKWDHMQIVVEAMRKSGHEFHVTTELGVYSCWFTIWKENGEAIEECADFPELPHAVALAALLAREGEDG